MLFRSRPDLDKVYQLAHQVLAQRGGGWPLTVFLAPGDLTPFFSGTYFPREARHGMPAFADVLERVAAFYHGERGSMERQNAALRGVFADLVPPPAAAGLALTAPLSVHSEGPPPNAHNWGENAIVHYVFPGTKFTEIGCILEPSAFITCSVATPVLLHGTSPLGRVERKTMRPSGRYAGAMSCWPD